jgi:hypothetical protein
MEKINLFQSNSHTLKKTYDASNKINKSILLNLVEDLNQSNKYKYILDLLQDESLDLNYPKIVPIYSALKQIKELQKKNIPLAENFYFLEIDECSSKRIVELIIYKLLEVIIESHLIRNSRINITNILSSPPLNLEIPILGKTNCKISKIIKSIKLKDKKIKITLDNNNTLKKGFDKNHICFKNQYFSLPFNDSILSNYAYCNTPIIHPQNNYLTQWKKNLYKGLNLLNDIYDNFSEISIYAKTILPTYSIENMITSSTSPDILGQLYLPYINDVTNLAECFLHECMHQYLYRIDSIDSIFKNDNDKNEIYYSPWRDDPRPLSGIFHGIFVFNEIGKYYIKLSEKAKTKNEKSDFNYRAYLRLEQVIIATEVLLKFSKLSSIGDSIISTIINDFEHSKEFIVLDKLKKKQINKQLFDHRSKFSGYKC